MVYFIALFIFFLQYNIPSFYVNNFPIFPDLLFIFIVFFTFKLSRWKILTMTFLLSLIQDSQINLNMLGSITFANLIAIHLLSSILLNKNNNAGQRFLYLIVFSVIAIKCIIFYSILAIGDNLNVLEMMEVVGTQLFLTFFLTFIINEMILPNKLIK